MPTSRNLTLALELAAAGWHILPLSPTTKRPLANCPHCRETAGRPPHPFTDCRCLAAGRWCHGVRAATTNPDTIGAWFSHQRDAIPAVAAGPSGLVLIDIDTHADQPPANPATDLLPGMNLATEHVPERLWAHPRDGRDALHTLAHLRGRPTPWPTAPEHQPLAVDTPSGGRHLWYQTPAPHLRQALSGPHGLAWQIDIKAGWSYGIAPGAITLNGHYTIAKPGSPGRMPHWLATEIIRVASPPPTPSPEHPPARPRPAVEPGRGAAYLTTIINRGIAELVKLRYHDGRKQRLAALAYKAGGYLTWSGLGLDHVTRQLTAAGTTSGLPHRIAERIVHRSLARGVSQPLNPPPRNYLVENGRHVIS